MKNLDVKHYLGIYKTRQEMQNLGITNPSDAVKDFTNEIVRKLSSMSLEEIITINDRKFIDSKGIVIIEFPSNI